MKCVHTSLVRPPNGVLRISATKTCTREDRLGLLQRLDLALARFLSRLEIIKGEVARLVDRPVHVLEVQEVSDRTALVGLVVGLLDYVPGQVLLVGDDARALRLDLLVSILDKGLVGSLR